MKKYIIISLILISLLSFSCLAADDSLVLRPDLFDFILSSYPDEWIEIPCEFIVPSLGDDTFSGLYIDTITPENTFVTFHHDSNKPDVYFSSDSYSTLSDRTIIIKSYPESEYYLSIFNSLFSSSDLSSSPTYDLKPLTDSIHQDLSVLVPIGIFILAIFLSVGLIPRIIYKFL